MICEKRNCPGNNDQVEPEQYAGQSRNGADQVNINPGPTDSNYWGDRQVPKEKFLKAEDVARVIIFVDIVTIRSGTHLPATRITAANSGTSVAPII